MGASNPSRFLESGGDERALALKMYAGTVLEAFRLNTTFYNERNTILDIKRITSGKSWQYPILGDDPAPEYHTPGDELLGQTQAFGEVVVTIDDILVGHRDIPHDQTLISHFPVVEPFARAIGRGLAISLDSKIARMGVKAARTAASSGFHSGGNVVSRTGGGSTIASAWPATSTGATNLRDDISQLAQLMDEDNVPRAGRFLVVTPYAVRVLQKDPTIFSKDYIASQNDVLSRVITELEGFALMVSNGIPTTNFVNSGPPSDTDKYDVDCRYVAGNVAAGTGQPIAIAFCGASEGQAAVGMTIAEEFYNHMSFDERRNTTFMKSQNMLGLGVVCPWMSGEIRGQLS